MHITEFDEEKNKGTVEEAVRGAMDYCVDHGILYDVLKNHRAEVYDMCITEFDAEKYRRTIEEVSREEGRAEGISQGARQAMISLVKKGLLSIENAAQESGLSVPEFEKLL